jgi:hypothetical protein
VDADSLGRLARQTSFHPVEGGAVVYDAAGKRLFALNAAAAFVWLSLRDSIPRDETVRDLASGFGLGAAEAEKWLELAIASFERAGFHEDAGSGLQINEDSPSQPPPAADAPGNDYLLLGQRVRIDAPAEALKLIDSMLGGLRQPAIGLDSKSPDLTLAVRPSGDGYCVSGAGGDSPGMASELLAAEVEQAMFQTIVPCIPHFLAFHAALLKRGETTLLLPAPSGSGKTTLSSVLAAHGWSYGSDEMAFLDRDLRFQGLPFPPCIKEGNYSLIERWHPALRQAPEHARFGRRVKFLPLHAGQFREAVATVVFPRFEPNGATRLENIESLTGLERLLTLCVYVPPGLTETDIARLVEWHGRATYFTLAFADPAEAVVLLNDAFAGLDEH